jgi:hypothetical protein
LRTPCVKSRISRANFIPSHLQNSRFECPATYFSAVEFSPDDTVGTCKRVVHPTNFMEDSQNLACQARAWDVPNAGSTDWNSSGICTTL